VNRLTKITDSANLAVAFAYDAASRLTSKTLPNGVAATYNYDGLDRLTRLKDAKGNSVIADNQYSYNSAGHITQNIDQSGTHTYGYDTVDRLISATYTGTPNETYAYDSVGNRTMSHKSATYGYQPFNQLISTSMATYIYNNNGNMISKSDAGGTTQFAWDFENRLTQVVTPASGGVTYKYDALGRRIQRTPSTGISTNFIYDGQDVVKDINSDGSIIEYLNGPGIDNKIRQKGSSTTTTYYFSQDHLGSTTALTGTTGKLVERITYDGYGNSAGSTRTRYGFTGRERDQLSGLLYFRARFYDPQVGRFISEDQIGLAGGINQFGYVQGNPINAIDPSGLSSILVVVGARSAGGSGGAYIMLLDKYGKRISYRDCGCADADVASGRAVASDPNRMLGNGVGDTPFGVYNFSGTQGGAVEWRDPNHPAGFGTGKILLDPLFGEVVDARRNLIRLHGGGTGLPDPYDLDQELRPTQGCVRMKNGEVNSLIHAINNLPKDDPLEFVFIGDDGYLNGLAANALQRDSRWQPVLRTNLGLP
jgi:RHS repeat-associated protein